MRTTNPFRKATRPGVGLLAAAALTAGALGAFPAATSAASASQSGSAAVNGTQADNGTEFPGYNGVVDAAEGLTATAAEDRKTKPADPTLGDPDDSHGQDVLGEEVVAEPDPSPTAFALPSAPDATRVAEVTEALQQDGRARVIVMTDTTVRPEAELGTSALRAQRADIADSLADLRSDLAGTGTRTVEEFTSTPAAVYSITDEGLDAMLDDSNVVSIVLDGQVESELASSTGVIDSDLLNTAGVLGNNFDGNTNGGAYQVAIIDSGVDNQHNAFTGRIVSQACYVTDASCLGGVNASTAAGSADECTHSNDCDHGTHVGGIAAGTTFTGGHEGVARGAGIVAIKVAQDNPASSRWTAFFSSIDSALSRVLVLKAGPNPNISAVNLSIGTASVFTAGNPACNAVNPNTALLFGQLQAAGVAVVVAAGNESSSSAMSFPGCATNAFAIGATNDADVPAGFSNSSADLRWWAPGVSIDAPVPTTNSHGPKDGTSMAAPHVAGSFALLRECVDGNGVPQTNAAAAADLDATGVDVTRNAVTRKRINVLDAATRNVNNNDFANAEVFAGNGPINDFDFTVCSDAEPGEPGPFSIDNGAWWTWTPATTGTATISTEDSGTNLTTFDTSLAVYTGNSLPTLQTVAFDDDSGTGLRSSVTFPVNGGTAYRIKVDGFAAANGLLNLHIENGPPPTCGGAAATFVGTTGNDVIPGTAGNDVIVAGDGDDTITGQGGNDRICGDAGVDTIDGGSGDDFVLGGSAADTITGKDGNDTLVGNPGGGSNDDAGDTIDGGTGNDFLDGWFGDDILVGGTGNDQLRGEAGVDLVTYALSPGAITASLLTNTATGDGNDTFVGVENLTGSDHNDRLIGDAVANVLGGRDGNDRIDGREGTDTLRGGADNDLLFGRAGNDSISGNKGTDTVGYDAAPGPVTVKLSAGVAAGDGNDLLGTVENVRGSASNDKLLGDNGPNRLWGLVGNDLLMGLGGKDLLVGSAGKDRMDGGTASDVCQGGPHSDTAVRCEVTTSVP